MSKLFKYLLATSILVVSSLSFAKPDGDGNPKNEMIKHHMKEEKKANMKANMEDNMSGGDDHGKNQDNVMEQ